MLIHNGLIYDYYQKYNPIIQGRHNSIGTWNSYSNAYKYERDPKLQVKNIYEIAIKMKYNFKKTFMMCIYRNNMHFFISRFFTINKGLKQYIGHIIANYLIWQ